MKKFIINISIYFLILAAAALLGEMYISDRLDHGYRYYFQADWHDLKDHNSDILFIGNSRTWVHIDPFAIQDTLKVKAEVLAEDGESPHLLWLKFKEYIKHNELPKELYLQFDPFFWSERSDLYGIKDFRTGFYKDRLDLSSLKHYSGYSPYYRYIPLAAIDFPLMKKIILSDTILPGESYEKTHGFMAQDHPWKGNWHKPDKKVTIDSAGQSPYVDSFFLFSKQKNISLYTIYPPQSPVSYEEFAGKALLPERSASLARKYDLDVTFLNFNDASKYNDSTLFYNHIHLNSKGVIIFTRQLLSEEKAFRSFRKK